MASRDTTTVLEDWTTIPVGQRTLHLVSDACERISTLNDLHAMTDGLHGTRGRRSVVQTIQRIAGALCATDEVAVFEVNQSRTHLTLLTAAGIDAVDLSTIRLGIGLIGRAAESGELYERFFEPDACLAAERHLRACIPLMMDRTPVGAIAVFGRQGHYLVQESLNHEWIRIFAKHAASALYWTGIYESAKAALSTDW